MKKIRKYEEYLRIAQKPCKLSKVFVKILIKIKESSSHCIVSTLRFIESN